ncbi:MAG: ferritin-like domain-containing protein [Actinomycetota bacterium]|nr:ferritin-like domain-containing protein [Actinomycetota bacterium]
MISRRRFLAGSAGFAVAGGCSSGGGGGPGTDPDLDVAATAARMERLAVDTYTSTRTSAVQGRFGAAVPQALVELMATAVGHHQECLNTWNRVLTAGRRGAVDAPDPRLRTLVDGATVRLTDIPAAATLVLRLEDYVSRTYLDALPTLKGEEVLRSAAQMLVVDQQHQAVLRYILGLYPVGSGTRRDTTDFSPGGATPDLLLSTP